MNKNEVQKLDLSVPTDFNINFTPAVISFQGYDELSKRVDQLVENLDGYQVTAKSYTADKKLRAELNKSAKELHDRAKYFIDLASKDTNDFKEKVDVQVKKIKGVSKQIDDGVKYYDNKVKQDKHDQNIKFIDKTFEVENMNASMVEYNPRWDNKSYSFLEFKKEIEAQLKERVVEKAVYDDAVKVINHKADELVIGSEPFVSSLGRGESLATILPKMDNYRKQLDEAVAIKKANQAAFEAKQKAKQQVHGNKVIDADTGQVVDEIVTVKFAVRGTKQQMQALGRFIKDNGIQVTSI